jgi:hypothetical protein
MLTSPLDGFSVPMKAMSSNGQNPSTAAKPSPVAAIRILAASRARRRGTWCATKPSPSVRIAEPRSVAVEIAPTASASKPSVERCTGSRIATYPSPKARRALLRSTRLASGSSMVIPQEIGGWSFGFEGFGGPKSRLPVSPLHRT